MKENNKIYVIKIDATCGSYLIKSNILYFSTDWNRSIIELTKRFLKRDIYIINDIL